LVSRGGQALVEKQTHSLGKPGNWTALHSLADGRPCADNVAIAGMLINAMSKQALDKQSVRLNTALHHAASRGNTRLVELLIDRGAALDIQNFDSKCPADMSKKSHAEVTAILLRGGAPLWA